MQHLILVVSTRLRLGHPAHGGSDAQLSSGGGRGAAAAHPSLVLPDPREEK